VGRSCAQSRGSAQRGVRIVLQGMGMGIGWVRSVGTCGVVVVSKAIAGLELMINCAALFMSFRL